MRSTAITWLAVVCASAAPAALARQPAPRLGAVSVADGLTMPAVLAAAPGDTSRLFIGELFGSAGMPNRADVRILDLASGQLLPTPFLSLTVSNAGEKGLLGLAFDPAYSVNGRFYIHHSNLNPAGSRLVRYNVSADPNVADPGSAAQVFFAAQSAGIHQGGWTGFGPDGYLYLALGELGTSSNSQSTANVFGKILRLDVATLPYAIPPTNPFFGTASAQEIWAMGLRNPWRCGFDRLTGDLWIADVGPISYEEINHQPAATTPPFAARNYGWPCATGPLNNCTVPVIPPVHYWPYVPPTDYAVGGSVYRGSSVPELRGSYFFWRRGDSSAWSLRYDGQQVTELVNRTAELTPLTGPLATIVSFGEDARGELYMASLTQGRVYRIVPRCWANCNGSTDTPVLTIADFACFQAKFAAADPYADCNSDGAMTIADFACFQSKFVAGCP